METQVMSFHYHFHVLRHYFECHDILEEHWKDQTRFSKNDAIVSLILFSTACYHYRRGNVKGALKTYKKSLQIAEYNDDFDHLGIERTPYISIINSEMMRIAQGEAYRNIQLPLTNACYQALESSYDDFEFNYNMDVSDYIKHHHLLRDRTEVIESRMSAFNQRHSKL
ncbi:DUF309 domain-containing protein [Mammaliicoccus vitulinus]|uniref:DUF309 domain-containing protein n=1 Tax=Mammaliicoccus vitulinus TaxID=71237 RepID=UPI00145B99F5|nr:DUF309 domain-containing protein [Mammaliicoccus vitulinus]QJF25171.1 DUF309 domain-containing protein [Mammaliicoccus vitulinus]